jgi:hypothetical protein
LTRKAIRPKNRSNKSCGLVGLAHLCPREKHRIPFQHPPIPTPTSVAGSFFFLKKKRQKGEKRSRSTRGKETIMEDEEEDQSGRIKDLEGKSLQLRPSPSLPGSVHQKLP